MIKKIRRKFVLITFLVTLFVIGGITLCINLVNYSRYNRDYNVMMDVLLNNNGRMPLPTKGGPNRQRENSDNSLDLESYFKIRYFSVVIKENNEVISVYVDNMFSIDREAAIELTTKLYSNNKYKGTVDSLKYKSKKVSTGELYVFVDCYQEQASARNLATKSSLIAIFAILIILVSILIISKWIVKPIQETYEKQKRFITDANHEIKTPLTIIATNNEILEMNYGDNEWNKNIEKQIKRLTVLTDELVILSKMDEEKSIFTKEKINVSNIVYEIMEPYISYFNYKKIEFKTNIEESIFANVNDDLIKRMISIFLDNAAKYVNDDGTVLLSLTKTSKSIKLIITNSTNGIPKGNLDYLFDRFYRLEESRNSMTGGHGIGLSMASEIANYHNGKISAYSEDGINIKFTFIF